MTITYLDHLLEHGLHLVQSLLKSSVHTLCKLLVFLLLFSECLLLLLSSELLLGGTLLGLLGADLVNGCNVTDSGALVVDNIAVFINLLAVTLCDVASSELADEVSVLVNDITFLVDLEAGARVTLLLLLLWLVADGVANGVTIGVDDITVLVDLVAFKSSTITVVELTANLAISTGNSAILLDAARQEASKRSLLLTTTLSLRKKLSTTNNVATVVPDLTHPVTDLANKSSWVTLDDDTIDGAVLVDEFTSLVHNLTSECRTVDFFLGLRVCLFPALSVAENVTHTVNDITIGVDLLASELLGITVGDLTNLLAARDNVAVLLDDGVGEVLEWSRLLDPALVGRNGLGLTNNVTCMIVSITSKSHCHRLLFEHTFVTPDLALLGYAVTNQGVKITFNKFTEDHATVVDDITSLVDGLTLEDRVIDLDDLFLGLLIALGVANGVTVLVTTGMC